MTSGVTGGGGNTHPHSFPLRPRRPTYSLQNGEGASKNATHYHRRLPHEAPLGAVTLDAKPTVAVKHHVHAFDF